jgi:hypothetical protein
MDKLVFGQGKVSSKFNANPIAFFYTVNIKIFTLFAHNLYFAPQPLLLHANWPPNFTHSPFHVSVFFDLFLCGFSGQMLREKLFNTGVLF